ncbi:MAG: DNA polymerase III subunit chi [Betaproteobacteria bacterium]|nr:DNA polymerase III subunit chi [Betaproteobacteria bacterium]
MTRIDFYSNAEPKLNVACQLAAKAVQQQLRVLIFSPDAAIAGQIDRQLWTWQATGFLPHCFVDDPLAADTPILIARSDDSAPHDQVLMNLSDASPPSFSRFQRLIELVGTEESDKQSGRARFRFYRDRGYEIVHHDLAKP